MELPEIEVTQVCSGGGTGGTREERAQTQLEANATSAQVLPREVVYNSPATVTTKPEPKEDMRSKGDVIIEPMPKEEPKEDPAVINPFKPGYYDKARKSRQMKA